MVVIVSSNLGQKNLDGGPKRAREYAYLKLSFITANMYINVLNIL